MGLARLELDPSPKFQLYVYGDSPPETHAVKAMVDGFPAGVSVNAVAS